MLNAEFEHPFIRSAKTKEATMLDMWELHAPDEYVPGTFDEEIVKYFEES